MCCGGCFAIITDIYSGKEAVKYIGFIGAIITGCMIGAPVLGSFVNYQFGWRANFTLVAVLGVISLVFTYFQLPETNKNFT